MTDYLTLGEQAQMAGLRHRDFFAREALQQVDRILTSRRFDRVQQRAKDFLSFVVAKTLLGQADQIKETTVALAVFEESTDFNPAETSKVRVAATDLRQRLAGYAQNEGQHDIIQILMPLNTYVPEIRDRRIAVAITEFENWHPLGKQRYLCAAISAEIAELLCNAGLRAGLAEGIQVGTSARQYALRGSVESLKDVLRINVSLSDPAHGDILCSRSFEGQRDDILKLTCDAAEALIEVLTSAVNHGVAAPVSRHRRATPKTSALS